MRKTCRILGIRGIPAAHGGFETFAERLAVFMVERGWRVVVYCQEHGTGEVFVDEWNGVERVRIPVRQGGALGTVVFDWKALLHAAQFRDICLTLGYNTAVFCLILRLFRVPNIINMDGIEWARAKWGALAKCWFWVNDWLGCWLGDHLVADHPEIAKHLGTRVGSKKISMIPYGADCIADAPAEPLLPLGLAPNGYVTLIARPEPENSVLEIVRGFSAKQRGILLVVLGAYDPNNLYHKSVLDAAGSEVRFLGAVYDRQVVDSLRFHSRIYLHGHQVGGTNPSLLEAMGASNPVVAHDNRFNRWVAGTSARYFKSSDDVDTVLSELLDDRDALDEMSAASSSRHADRFSWGNVLRAYEQLLAGHCRVS